jgi:hypothetical protein
MFAHVVLFKPKPGLDPAGRQRLAAVFERALREIPSIRRAHVGRRVLNGRPYEQLMTVDYEYAAILEFDTAQTSPRTSPTRARRPGARSSSKPSTWR